MTAFGRAGGAVFLTLATLVACSGGGGGSGPAPVSTTAPVVTAAPATPGATASAAASASASPSSKASSLATPTAPATTSPTSPSGTPTPFNPPEGGTLTSAPTSSASAAPPQVSALDPRINLASGFSGVMIASVSYARQMAALPNGDLLVGTLTSKVMLVPQAENADAAGSPVTYATLPEGPAQSVAYSDTSGSVYVATQHHVYKIPYVTGDQSASGAATDIVDVRTGSVAPNSDGDVHETTSVAVSGNFLYIAVGSSCNACTETDSTRAVVLRSDLSGGGLTTVATRIRNAIAIAPNPNTSAIWLAGAGQDCLTVGTTSCGAQDDSYLTSHPYEYVDNLSAHTASGTPVDYHWPDCEENRQDRHSFNAAWPTADCSAAIVPAIEFPSFGTHIGVVVYPSNENGTYAFPAAYKNGLFVTVHGSWHETSSGIPVTPPNVAFVPMSGDAPATAVDWSNPNAQWQTFMSGFQDQSGQRIGRPTGVTVGSRGSLFVADDFANAIYRIRYGTQTTSSRARRF